MRFVWAFLLATVLAPPAVANDDYPSRQITLVAPYAPGGATDAAARILAEQLRAAFNVTVIVENRPGGGGRIGSMRVVRAAADGYTLLVTSNGSMTVLPALSENVEYNPSKDFTHVSLVGETFSVLGIRADLGVRTFAEFLALAKRQEKPLTYGSPGIGSVGNLAGELLQLEADIKILHVPFQGSNPAMQNLLGGHLDFMIDPLVIDHSKTGKLVALAVTSTERFPGLPEVPTMREAGCARCEILVWNGLFGPANLPPAVVAKLNAVIKKATADKAYVDRMFAAGFVARSSTPEFLRDTVRTEVERFTDVRKKANIKVD